MKKTVIAFLLLTAILFQAQGQSPAKRYEQMQRELATGWNTWDTRNVLTHVLLPYGAAIDLNLTNAAGQRVNNFRIGDRNPEAPVMHPGPHTYDGFYTDISLDWKGQKLRVQSASEGRNNLILITPLSGNEATGKMIITPKALWYRENKIEINGNTFTLAPLGEDWKINAQISGDVLETNKQEIIVSTAKPIVIACGLNVDLAGAQAFIQSHYDAFVKKNKERFGNDYEVYNAMQNVLGWDNIYDPSIRKVITTVSRIWNMNNSMNPSLGGYSLYCWDTYFASMMLATGSKELAYANAVEITNTVTEEGFVPNFTDDNDYKSRDRSQPPVGSMAFWNIYQKYKEKWVLEYVYDKLLSWNRWWDKNRAVDGLLCWGSTPFEKVTYRYWETKGVNDTFGGALESGLDNSHMYDDIPFDKEKHVQKLNDVGLSSLYVMDCDLLAKIADELGKASDAKELRKRGETYRKNLNKLWDGKQGFYYNRHTDTGTLNQRTSPTNFYPLLANAPTQAQAERMVKEHLLNPDEFWGEWVIPTTPRNDPAFKDNNYWRGRIWAPLNFLVYMGLRNYDLPEARKALSEKSKSLLLKSWLSNGYVFENYNSVTGAGDDVRNSDKFYHWGALLGFITLMEDGYFTEEKGANNTAIKAEETEDWEQESAPSSQLKTTYLTPVRVVWKNAEGAAAIINEQALLTSNTGQADLVNSNVCSLKSGELEFPSIVLDFGKEIQGGIQIVTANTKGRIRIRLGESVSEVMHDFGEKGSTNDHAIRDEILDLPNYGVNETGNSGFRFVRIDLLDKKAELKLKEVRAKFTRRDIPYLGSFKSNDELLNQIWKTGAYTVHLNMQDYLWDGIKRDRLVWVGDMHPEVSTIRYTFGYNEVVPKSLDFIRDLTPVKDWMNGISSYTLWWVIIQRDWYQSTGDLKYLQAQKAYLLPILERLISFVDETGSEKLNGNRFLDWPSSGNLEAIHGGLQAMLAWGLSAGGELCTILQNENLANQCRQAVAQLKEHHPEMTKSKQAAALLSITDMISPEAGNALISDEGVHRFSTFYGYYMLQALAKAGNYDGALNSIREYWGGMLKLGATTFWEDFDIDWLDNASRIDELPQAGKVDVHADYGDYCYKGLRHSFCHGWASGPTAWLSEQVLGVQIVEPGCKVLKIVPHLGDLEWVEGSFPTPYGVVQIKHVKQSDGKIKTTVNAPKGVKIIK